MNKKQSNSKFLKIDELYAFIAVDKDGEGVMAFKEGGIWIPMIGADMERVDSLKPFADHLSKKSGIPYEIRRFKRVD